ncbi:MAG: hypothetical protein M3066_07860 [Actinomycetota bacterium]|nr:hypothetical protein [Actinomycetota bacterium]
MFCVVLGACAAIASTASAATTATIVSRGPATSVLYANGTTSVRLQVPFGTHVGDVLVASVGYGGGGNGGSNGGHDDGSDGGSNSGNDGGSNGGTSLRAPAEWTQVSRTNSGSSASLVIFTHVFAAGETSYTWRAGSPVLGVAFLAAFGGVDAAHPVDGVAGRELPEGGSRSPPPRSPRGAPTTCSSLPTPG